MSLSSANPRDPRWRVRDGVSRTPSATVRRRRPSVSHGDAYLYALRVAYLAYLLQPRSKRGVSKPLSKAPLNRTGTSTSIHDFMKGVRDQKSTRYPHGFISALDKRLKGVLVGQEKRPEFQNADVKRSFAVFLNQVSDPGFKQRMEADRRAEDLVLIFFASATKEMQKGKPPSDEGVKRTVDRHVALFVRLLTLILKDNNWLKDRTELSTRLSTLESKLMKHEEDLASPTVAEGSAFEEEVPLTHEVKDMPLVQVVGRIFGLRQSMLQSDIDQHKSEWTEKAALQDLKTYQAHLNVSTKRTLSSDDFDTQEAFEEWKKAEHPDLSQMMLAIMQSNPQLAKSTPGGSLPQFSAQSNGNANAYAELSHTLSNEEAGSSYVLNLPEDMSSLHVDDDHDRHNTTDSVYTFIPSDPRGVFQYIMKRALTFDLNDQPADGHGSPAGLLSRQSTELLNEAAVRWRIPMFSRLVIFLDVVKDKFIESDINLDTLDAAFMYAKQPTQDDTKGKKGSSAPVSILNDRQKWTLADFTTMQQLLSAIYDSLLRNLYEAMMTCYDAKPDPTLGPILEVIDEHIRSDPNFAQPTELFEQFRAGVANGLVEKAKSLYTQAVENEIPPSQETWEFFHLIQLKKAVMKLCTRVQKRYGRNPEIMGVELQDTFYGCVLPSFAEDSEAIIKQIIEHGKTSGQEVPIQDGFDLYKEMAEYRGFYVQTMPDTQFPYSLEELLQEFVWKWLKTLEDQVLGWVETAVKHDPFSVRNNDPNQAPTQEERHSESVIDVFRFFNQTIDQISQLNWDDDFTYAKFMTALSKAIAAGITRYCDALDREFSREMDRLSPEQEAAANRTRQERFVQLAKDTWNQKDRVEPFNFYATSFVKLNDIAYAISQWDKLEKDVNVDACADVIKRNSPPPAQRQRKFSNFVFTIKVVEAEDLKACDVSGYSDPYVVLTDEYQKRLFKSKIVYRNLNPRFDETVDISTQGPLNLIATIWDWDTLGDHDYVGRTSLKLDPSHFGDFLPREYWLDLDTQGRMLVRVSMEGERDDIEFYFAKAFRALQRTQRDMTRKITDKLSTYINHCLSTRALRALLSRGISNTINNVSSFFNRNRASMIPMSNAPSEAEIINALKPLFNYFDDNFAIMQETLTSDAMIAVMTRLWKEVLATIEALLVPPLSDKPSQQRPLTQQELDIVDKWLKSLFDFFNARDEETGEENGVAVSILKSPKYHEIKTINFFYFETTENLVRESERMTSATAAHAAQRSRLSAPATLGQPSFAGGLLAAGSSVPSARRAKSIMVARNLGTMRKAKQEKWKAAQAEPNDDMILRILRMRPEASGYLRDRSRQKERLAAAAAAELIVRQSLAAGGGRMTGPSVVRR